MEGTSTKLLNQGEIIKKSQGFLLYFVRRHSDSNKCTLDIYSSYAICERLVIVFDSVEAAFSILSQLETTSTLVLQKWIFF
jgi:hypothetical protein